MPIPRIRDLDPRPEDVLAPAELARLARYKRLYTVESLFGIEGREAVKLADRLAFVAWLAERGRVES